MTPYDVEEDGGLDPPRRHRPRARAGVPAHAPIVTSLSGWAFAETVPSRQRPPVGHPAPIEHRYTRRGNPLDLHAFFSPEDPLVAWIRAQGAQLTDAGDRARVMRGARRRVVSAQVAELLIVDARHPKILRAARVERSDLDADDPRARGRVADLARRIPGIGGLRVPSTPGGEADGLVVFPTYVRRHVTFLGSRVESVEPLVLRALRGERPSLGSSATIVDLDAVRRERKRSGDTSTGEAAATSTSERTDQ